MAKVLKETFSYILSILLGLSSQYIFFAALAKGILMNIRLVEICDYPSYFAFEMRLFGSLLILFIIVIFFGFGFAQLHTHTHTHTHTLSHTHKFDSSML